MKRNEFIERYWLYYLALENDFIKTIRFVSIDSENYNAFSNEYVRQLLSIGSEIDVVLKGYCSIIDSLQEPDNIRKYAAVLLNNNNSKNIINKTPKIKRMANMIYQPWKDWYITACEYVSPNWWTCYNNVKHNRITSFKEGNLENVINALSGLYLLEMFYCKEICDNSNEELTVPLPKSELFEMENWEEQNIIVGEGMIFKIID